MNLHVSATDDELTSQTLQQKQHSKYFFINHFQMMVLNVQNRDNCNVTENNIEKLTGKHSATSQQGDRLTFESDQLTNEQQQIKCFTCDTKSIAAHSTRTN
jgi:hypothetical protein